MKDGEHDNHDEKMDAAFNVAAKPRLEIDIEKYQAYLDGSDLTPAQKEDFLRALWSIVVAFVDLGFGVHPVQQACGQTKEILDLLPKADSDGVSSPDTDLTTKFNDAPDEG